MEVIEAWKLRQLFILYEEPGTTARQLLILEVVDNLDEWRISLAEVDEHAHKLSENASRCVETRLPYGSDLFKEDGIHVLNSILCEYIVLKSSNT